MLLELEWDHKNLDSDIDAKIMNECCTMNSGLWALMRVRDYECNDTMSEAEVS
jgi:hypothetical protein